jgi:hypothetical protein
MKKTQIRENNINKEFILKQSKYGLWSKLTIERAKLYENGDILLLRAKYVDLYYDMIVEDMVKIYGKELNIIKFLDSNLENENNIFDSYRIIVNSKKCKEFICRPLTFNDLKIIERDQKLEDILNSI